uniref:Aminopeptidase n=1 Tax=Myripristis murdjan TaxID=586833 RepID=A0A668AE60_9TELE
MKGFYISKPVGVVAIILGVGALATIIALSVVYDQEKSKNNEVSPTNGGTTSNPITTPTPSNEPWDKYRLPTSLVPDQYHVTLWPRLTRNETTGLYIFTGKSTVEFVCAEETDLILIHSNKLNYTTLENGHSARLTSAGGGVAAPSIKHSWLKIETQYLVIQLDGKLVKDQRYHLYTEFTGELADDLGGFYRSEYTENGVDKVVATTQMQPTDARKAFPCFDEPAMKAVFYITLIHQHGTIALSNGMENSKSFPSPQTANVLVTAFAPTKKMSTYLLAFIVSDFGFVSEITEGLLIRIYARKNAIAANQGEYALNVTGPILKFFEDYYNASYPLPKSDQIALPDFNAGAMENWGLITYRETALLYDTEFSSNSNKERIASIISHELAHMWFGNLVTLRWWNDLWLNEGFASYVEYLGADYAEPSWNVKDLIVLSDVHRVFAVDALASSHPLSSNVDDIQKPAQISELFDAISYSKGASVLRMLSDFLTEDVFKKGLSTYLNKFAYGNTVYTDLWDHLQEAAVANSVALPGTVHTIMNRWVLQMGFPVVTIDTTTGAIHQKHFLLDPESNVTVPSEFKYIFLLPLISFLFVVGCSDTFVDMKTSGADWVLANLNVSGYYRVNYDQGNWDKLLDVLNNSHQVRHKLCDMIIIRSFWGKFSVNMVSCVLAIILHEFLIDMEYMPWESALDNLDYFSLMFDRSEVYGPMQAYLKKQVTPVFNYYKEITGNWTKVPDGHMEQYNQVNAISLACRTGMEECQTLIKTWFSAWMSNPETNPIHPNLRSTVYCNAIAAGGDKEWDFAWKQFKNAAIAIEADKLRSALACTKQPWLLNRYLEYTLDPNMIRKQDATSTIVYIAQNVVGQSLAWDFVRARWSYIFTQYGGGSFSFSNLVNGVTERFSTEFELQQLKQFKADNAEVGFGSGTLAVEQSIERTIANIKWISENEKEILDWFTAEAKP